MIYTHSVGWDRADIKCLIKIAQCSVAYWNVHIKFKLHVDTILSYACLCIFYLNTLKICNPCYMVLQMIKEKGFILIFGDNCKEYFFLIADRLKQCDICIKMGCWVEENSIRSIPLTGSENKIKVKKGQNAVQYMFPVQRSCHCW